MMIIIIIIIIVIITTINFVLLRSALLCLRGLQASGRVNLELFDIVFNTEKGHACNY